MYPRSLIICLFVSLACAQIRRAWQKPSQLIGGRDPVKSEVKYLVVVNSFKSRCGGGIIGDKYVLTAAHCIKVNPATGKLKKPVRIIANTNSSHHYSKGAIVVDVARVFLERMYSKGDYAHDIAVLELKKKLDFKADAGKIEKLNLPEPLPNNPTKYPTYDNEIIKFAGYGKIKAILKSPIGEKKVIEKFGNGDLQVAIAKITNDENCRNYSQKHADVEPMCLEVIEDETKTRQQGTCTGDSGSPAVNKDKVVVGINSRGYYCNNNLAPSLFTRVSRHMPFIKKALENDQKGLVVVEA